MQNAETWLASQAPRHNSPFRQKGPTGAMIMIATTLHPRPPLEQGRRRPPAVGGRGLAACRRGLVGRFGAGGRRPPQPVASRPAGFVHRRTEHQLHERLQHLLPLLRLLPRPRPARRLYAEQGGTGRQDRRDRGGRRHPDPAPRRTQPGTRHRVLRRPLPLAQAAVSDRQSSRPFGRRNPARLQGFQPVDRGKPVAADRGRHGFAAGRGGGDPGRSRPQADRPAEVAAPTSGWPFTARPIAWASLRPAR